MEFLLGVAVTLYGLAFLAILFSNLLGIGLGEFSDMPGILNYPRAVISAAFWPLELIYSILVRQPRRNRQDEEYTAIMNKHSYVLYGRDYPEENPPAVAEIFKRHPFLHDFTIRFLNDGGRNASLSLLHRSSVMDSDELPSWSPARRAVEAYMAVAEPKEEEPWEDYPYPREDAPKDDDYMTEQGLRSVSDGI